jgi:hypothetical protein
MGVTDVLCLGTEAMSVRLAHDPAQAPIMLADREPLQRASSGQDVKTPVP